MMVDTTNRISESVVAMYPNYEKAEKAVDALINAGFERQHINLISNDVDNRYSRYFHPNDDSHDDVSAGEGFTFGAFVGMLTGLAVAIIPGIGPVIAVGPFATALITGIGLATGAFTGGIVAGLIDLGAEREHAETYAEFIRRGGTLVIVDAVSTNQNRADDILMRYDPLDVDIVSDYYRDSGWTGYDTDAEPWTTDALAKEHEYYHNDYDAEQRRIHRYPAEEAATERARRYGYKDFNAYQPTFRDHWNAQYGALNGDYVYDTYIPAYQFGYNLATMPRYYSWTWDRLEPVARDDWEDNYDGSWDDYSGAIKHAWDKVTMDDETYYQRYRW